MEVGGAALSLRARVVGARAELERELGTEPTAAAVACELNKSGAFKSVSVKDVKKISASLRKAAGNGSGRDGSAIGMDLDVEGDARSEGARSGSAGANSTNSTMAPRTPSAPSSASSAHTAVERAEEEERRWERIHAGRETMNAAESRYLRDTVRHLTRVGAIRRSRRFADGGGELPVVCSPAYARWDEALGQYRWVPASTPATTSAATLVLSQTKHSFA